MAKRVRGRIVAGGVAVTTVVAGVATNQIEGPWWVQAAWFTGAVTASTVAVWLAGAVGPADSESSADRPPELEPPAVEAALRPPFGRLPDEVCGRDGLVQRLTELLECPDGRFHVLTGLGGAGKSTVALQLADIALEQGRPVWWSSAMDGVTFSSALLWLARVLGADREQLEEARAGHSDPCDVLWAMLEASSGWLLIVDNADDVRDLAVAGRTPRDGNGWIRGSRGGLVLVTTRDGDPRHWGRSAELHRLEWLSDRDGGRVLMGLAPDAGSQRDAEALSARLGGLPLALHHAGLQLASPFSGERTFTDYLRALERDLPAALEPAGQADHREIVTRTWELSLEQLADAGLGEAHYLLEVLAWFAGAAPIPAAGLNQRILGDICASRNTAEVLAALYSIGLIEHVSAAGVSSGHGTDLVLHPLVASVTRITGARKSASAEAAARLLEHATADLAEDDPASWAVWNVWLPHLDEMLDSAAPHLTDEVLGTLLRTSANAADALLWAGATATSMAVAGSALRHADRLGSDDHVVLVLRNLLANGYDFTGDTAQAQRLFQEIHQARKRTLGADHPLTMNTLHGLARTFTKQGDHVQAEHLFRQVHRARKRSLGSDHRDTLDSRKGIALAIARQGDPAKAQRILQAVLQEEEQALGTRHPHTLKTRFEIATLVAAQGDHMEAQRLFSDLFDMRATIFGAEHPDTLATRRAIAEEVARQGDSARAEQILREILQSFQRTRRSSHPDAVATARLLNGIRGTG